MPKREQILKMQLDNALFKNDRILSITKDRHGVIWIGTFNYGVFSIIMDDKKQPVRYFKHFKEFSKNKSLENADIRVIVPDENNAGIFMSDGIIVIRHTPSVSTPNVAIIIVLILSPLKAM